MVAFRIRNFQPIFSVRSAWLNTSEFFCNNQGRLTSTDTSPVAVSKNVPCSCASFGIFCTRICRASSSDFLIDSSVLTTILS